MTTSDELIEALSHNYTDTDFYLIVADCLEDEGQKELAAAYRWCGLNKQYPFFSPYLTDHPWFFCGYQFITAHRLNIYFDGRLRNKGTGYADSSFTNIMNALACAIEEYGL